MAAGRLDAVDSRAEGDRTTCSSDGINALLASILQPLALPLRTSAAIRLALAKIREFGKRAFRKG
jgi:hypothetical protein